MVAGSSLARSPIHRLIITTLEQSHHMHALPGSHRNLYGPAGIPIHPVWPWREHALDSSVCAPLCTLYRQTRRTNLNPDTSGPLSVVIFLLGYQIRRVSSTMQ